MAKQIEGVYERVLECARREFLQKGFTDASLRKIASEAGTSTSSIYTRFTDKNGLFCTLVEPAATTLKEGMLDIRKMIRDSGLNKSSGAIREYMIQAQMKLLMYVYDHFDEFYLLIEASMGTEYAGYIDELVEIVMDYTYQYLKDVRCKTVLSGAVTEEFIHILSSSYCNGLFEPIRHKMSREKAQEYMQLFSRYHMAGFSVILDAAEKAC